MIDRLLNHYLKALKIVLMDKNSHNIGVDNILLSKKDLLLLLNLTLLFEIYERKLRS